MPSAISNVIIAPAEDPEISSTSVKLFSIDFRQPINENIPIAAGPITRYLILLLSRIEEIDDVKSRTQQRTPLRG